jgi:hypothetical protein
MSLIFWCGGWNNAPNKPKPGMIRGPRFKKTGKKTKPALTGGFFFAQKKRPQLGGKLRPSLGVCAGGRPSMKLIVDQYPADLH